MVVGSHFSFDCYQVKEIRSFICSVFLTKLELSRENCRAKAQFLCKFCTILGVFIAKHLGRGCHVFWDTMTRSAFFPFCETGTPKVSAFGFGCSHFSKKVNDCGFVLWMVTHCLPVNAVSHRGLTLVLTLWDIFKENITELGVASDSTIQCLVTTCMAFTRYS